ncbi:helix-turn-helix domain-containing protein [uncultured Azonexus sp.]|uniref:helix-turn-helix domain-containing protein n=1 Tax=uncultured Azonexus sp. TaxID=520307 RepID=UPI00260211AB|nr:helix-turn-helix domain-containing protein [uncultured Azonexus sp.]
MNDLAHDRINLRGSDLQQTKIADRLCEGFKHVLATLQSCAIFCNMGRKLQLPDEPLALGAAIESARHTNGYTMETLGKLAGVNRSQISLMASGKIKTVSSNVRKVCNVLQIDPDQLLSRKLELPSEVLQEIYGGWLQAGDRRNAYEKALVALSRLFS